MAVNHPFMGLIERQKEARAIEALQATSRFSTDLMFLTVGLGEGPVYRINPNGSQDVQIQDSSIDDLVNLDGDGGPNLEKFYYLASPGNVSQKPLPNFGDEIVSPQTFASPVNLKFGNAGTPQTKVELQETSAAAWDVLKFDFIIERLFNQADNGDIQARSLSVLVRVFDSTGTTQIATKNFTIENKIQSPVRKVVSVDIPTEHKSENGYRFTVEKTSEDKNQTREFDTIRFAGWSEVRYEPLAYPRTAIVGYAIKATDEHQGAIPNITSLVKGKLIKVPSNYNQPTLASGEVDWRHLEVSDSGADGYPTRGYYLQNSGSTILYDTNPQIYTGIWDGSFVYSWSQNPVWIIYDILTNKEYGLGIAEANIDKYKFYKVAQYCDACDSTTGRFNGVTALSDGSFRYKPRGLYSSTRENQIGLPSGTQVKERRFISDISLNQRTKGIDLINSIAATIRSILVYAGGKITMAVDMPDEVPVITFNEANIKKGSFKVAGNRQSDIKTGVEVAYQDPTNSFKREIIIINAEERNRGEKLSEMDNIITLDLFGVTRRSQAMRMGQYHLAGSKYQRRIISFQTQEQAMFLSPGDVISISSTTSGVNYGYGGKITADSAIGESNNTYVFLEHFTDPVIPESFFTGNTYPIALRVTKNESDKTDLYIISDSDYELSAVNSPTTDRVTVKALSKYDLATKETSAITTFTSSIAPAAGDYWSIGEMAGTLSFYTSRAGRLFKVQEVRRGEDGIIDIIAAEYLPEIYVDSDNFIDYDPISYNNIQSLYQVPPTPSLQLTKQPKTLPDGSIRFDVRVDATTNRGDTYYEDFGTEYYLSTPSDAIILNNASGSAPLSITFDNTEGYSDKSSVTLLGKNGFASYAGEIKLLCNTVTIGTDTIQLTVEGLNVCHDVNFDEHVLAVNDGGSYKPLKGANRVLIPVNETATPAGLLNFVGYATNIREASRDITAYDIINDTITIEDTVFGETKLSSSLPSPPFYVKIGQILDKDIYTANTFYVSGFTDTFNLSGTFSSGFNTIELPVKPNKRAFTRFYVDNVPRLIDGVNPILNLNKNLDLAANIQYTTSAQDSSYRVEIDHYSVPAFELGDRVELTSGNTFTVINSSFDVTSDTYDAALTSNNIFRVQLDSSPNFDITNYEFTNITPNPVGALGNVSGDSATFDYSTSTYPGSINLANSRIYRLGFNGEFVKTEIDKNNLIKDLPIGISAIRARNINFLGKTSPFVTKTVNNILLPIQRVQNIVIRESLYREQNSGISVRATVEFDHITDQEVTDYEISYRISAAEELGGDTAGVTNFNTVKVAATGVEDDGKIRFTINNVDRGSTSGVNTLTARITPLNRSIRGISTTVSQAIEGKTVKPRNVRNFTGGQQTDQITLFWQYERIGDQLADLDLKEVVIRRIAGAVEPTLANFLAANELVTVSAGTARKSIPIDTFGTFTYLAVTRDTSDNLSDSVVGVTISTTRPKRNTTIAAYNEDSPSEQFSSIPNTNAGETNYPSFNDSNTGGLSYSSVDSPFDSSVTDNANGTSTGFSAVAGNATDILADDGATYITQIRDIGTTVVGTITIDIASNQAIQSTYNDQKDVILSGASEISPSTNVFIDTDFGGIGTYLSGGRFDANNSTWMTGPANGNVWAIWNPGQFVEDISNANSYALIAGIVNSTTLALGATYHANGEPTGSNSLANLTTSPGSYQLVDLKQYSDLSTQTFEGDLGVVRAQTFVRTATDDVYYEANGNVDSSAFIGGTVNDGFVPYEAGSKTFRYFQIKHVITNSDPSNYDLLIDRFRYTVDKEQTITSNTVLYDSSPKTVNYTDQGYLTRPVISYAILDQIDAEANPVIAVTTAASNQSLSFKLFASNGSGEYNANSTANVMITIVGV